MSIENIDPKQPYHVRKWRWIVQHMERLIELNAPPVIKAQALVTLFIPRIVRMCECSKEFAEQLAISLCERINIQSFTCIQCKKGEIIGDEYLCAKCLAEMDQALEEYNDISNDLDDNDDDPSENVE